MHWTRRHSRGRPPHPDVLTPAEWRVLELVREGKTNAEIAIDLGLAIPTVKTHVSRIFAKTGTTNRQELASWEGAPSAASRAALSRGFSLPLLGWLSGASTAAKVASAGAAGVVLVGAIAVVLTMFGSDSVRGVVGSDSGTVTGYYMESIATFGARSDEPRPIIERARTIDSRHWFVDHSQWRVESQSRLFHVTLARSTAAVSDGTQIVVYDELREQWSRYAHALVEGDEYRSLLGPAPGNTVDEVIETIKRDYNTEVTRAGDDLFLGHSIEMLEFTVEWDGGGGNLHRLFVDPSLMVILLHDIETLSGEPLMRYEATHVEADVSIDRRLLELEPPGDAAIELIASLDDRPDCDAPPILPGGDSLAVHPTFLRPEYVPDRWTVGVGSGSSQARTCEIVSTWMVLHRTGEGTDAYILFDQARIPSGMPHWLAQGDPVDVSGHEGYRTTGDNIERLIWAQDGVVAMLEGRGVAFDELLRIAESARLVADAPPAATTTPAATGMPNETATP